MLDDPAATFVPERPVNPDPVSATSLLVMSSWLASCTSGRKGHETCPRWEHQTSALPRRVVDVTSGIPKLHTPNAGQVGRYAALSYCWGGPQLHCTTNARFAQYHSALPMNDLPATIQDAISITRALLIPFLWVDSLCIIQDSAMDKTLEMAKMSSVYRNSYVTFCASRAGTCRDGFLGIQEPTRDRTNCSATIPIRCPDGRIGSVMLQPATRLTTRRTRVDAPIHRRAWTYQEFLISPRVISFYHDALEFKCARGLDSDDGLNTEELRMDMGASQPHLSPLFYRQKSELLSRFAWRGALSSRKRQSLRQLWNRILSEYSGRRLSDLDDKLPAFSAIASEFHRLWGGQYLAGLWDTQLVHDMQWYAADRCHDRDRYKLPVQAVPSWSWASIRDAPIICHNTSEFSKQSPRVRVLKCWVDLVSKQAPFGLVKGGQLTITGPLKSMTILETWGCFGFDHNHHRTNRIGDFRSDFRWEPELPEPIPTLESILGIPNREPLFFLGLSMRPRDHAETSGLVLLEIGDGRYERIAVFSIDDHSKTFRDRYATSHWGDDYEVKTISIC